MGLPVAFESAHGQPPQDDNTLNSVGIDKPTPSAGLGRLASSKGPKALGELPSVNGTPGALGGLPSVNRTPEALGGLSSANGTPEALGGFSSSTEPASALGLLASGDDVRLGQLKPGKLKPSEENPLLSINMFKDSKVCDRHLPLPHYHLIPSCSIETMMY